MTRRSLVLAGILMAISAGMALAADVTGSWSGQMAGPNGDGFDISYTFKQDGAKLTGTVAGPPGDAIEITDGKIDGDKISFTINVHDQMVLKHEGTISGDSIKLTMKSDQGQFPGGEITLKRSK